MVNDVDAVWGAASVSVTVTVTLAREQFPHDEFAEMTPLIRPFWSMLSPAGSPEADQLNWPFPPPADIWIETGTPASACWRPGPLTVSLGYEHWTASLAVAEWPDGEVTVSVSPISQLFDAGVTESETPTLPPAGTDAVADPVLVPLERAQW